MRLLIYVNGVKYKVQKEREFGFVRLPWGAEIVVGRFGRDGYFSPTLGTLKAHLRRRGYVKVKVWVRSEKRSPKQTLKLEDMVRFK